MREGDAYPFRVKVLLGLLVYVEVEAPVIGRIDLRADREVNAAVSKLYKPYGLSTRGFSSNSRTRISLALSISSV